MEKPKFRFNINVGLYLLNKNILNLLKKKQYLDFNTLLEKSLKNNKKVGYYKIKDRDWVDVGRMDKYKNFLEKKI
jgi:NDP-sugar pyrophosphorylase family protein